MIGPCALLSLDKAVTKPDVAYLTAKGNCRQEVASALIAVRLGVFSASLPSQKLGDEWCKRTELSKC